MLYECSKVLSEC